MKTEELAAKLKNILLLEQRRGYNNKAVLGGVEAFIQKTVLPQASDDDPQAKRILKASEKLLGYSTCAPEERSTKVKEALDLLDGKASSVFPLPNIRQAPSRSVPDLEKPISSMPGVGQRRAALFGRLGIHLIRDALEYYPREYHDRSNLRKIAELQFGNTETFIAKVKDVSVRKLSNNLNLLTARLQDETGFIDATWFSRGFVRRDLEPGMEIIVTGKVGQFLGKLKLESPEYEHLDKSLLHSGRIVPIYRSTEGLNNKLLRSVIHDIVAYHSVCIEDHLPQHLIDELSLLDLGDALYQIHFPDSWDQLESARRRLAFDEFLEIQLGALMKQAVRRRSKGAIALDVRKPQIGEFLTNLPFRLTGAQERVIQEIMHDLESDVPMNRLLQGDVGSGKTVVAASALITAFANGYQGAIMAPTEILAEQHYKGISRLVSVLGEDAPKVSLLTGSIKGKERDDLYQAVEQGEIDILIGTHALIQEGVRFNNLAVCVVDEQHRFGVEQRAALRAKGVNPHLLVMTATPIPRSLALTIYGDLDLSVLDEMPPGRQPIQTFALTPEQRSWAYNFLREEVERGRQAYIICPLVEESEKIEAKAAIEEYERLQKYVFPDLRLGLLHGRMKPREKDEVMERFRLGELQVLVSTAVVEVGIDVPNATVMLIEGADRFGLAQLHQFRGRVGRGTEKSYCLLLSDSPSEDARKRLEIVQECSDGFVLAEEDLKMRGPGEFYGIRQSGQINLKVAKLSDFGLLEETRKIAAELLEDDPDLRHYPKLRSRVVERMKTLSEAN